MVVSTTPKILFVDDEINILKALEQLMLEEEWHCHFVNSGEKALEFLKTEPVDLIVSDVMMPEMDGIRLFSEIRKHHPEIVRIFLTGYTKQDNVIKAMTEGHTQQIIPKPWIEQEFKEVIRSALRQSALQKKHSPRFQQLINSTSLLPTLPESYTDVRSCITEDEVNIEKMADYISQDVAISSALLHWANSALFGQRFQVDTIKKAIIVLGTDIVENLILSESVNRTIALKSSAVKGFDFARFKRHSMATAVIARLLIKTLHGSDVVKHDRAFVAGLLHDMGKLAAASFFPQQFERAIEIAQKRNWPLTEAEMGVYGTQHAEIGAFLAEWWALPPFIVNAICWHHRPQSTPVEQDVIEAAHVANLLSYQFNYGCNGDTTTREIDEEYQVKFYLSDETIEFLKSGTEKIMASLSR